MWTLRRTTMVQAGAMHTRTLSRATHSATLRRVMGLPFPSASSPLLHAAQPWNASIRSSVGQHAMARCMSTNAASGGAANGGSGGSGAAGNDAASHTNDAAAATAVDADVDGNASNGASMSAMPPAPAGSSPAVRSWAALPPHHRSLEHYESALRTLRRLQSEALAAGLRYAPPANATTEADAEVDTEQADIEVGGDSTGAPASASGSVATAPREFSSEELSHATLEFQKGNRAPLAALMARKAPLSAAQVAAKARAASKPALPASYRLGSVAVLPWGRPLLPGTKTTLRIPIKDIAPFLEHITSQAKSASSTQEVPRYVALFNRLPAAVRDEQGSVAERPQPVEPAAASREAASADASEATTKLEKESEQKAELRNDRTLLNGPPDEQAWTDQPPQTQQQTQQTQPQPSSSSTAAGAAETASSAPSVPQPAAASKPGFSVPIEDGNAPKQQQQQAEGDKVAQAEQADQIETADMQEAPVGPIRARPFPRPSHPLKFKRATPQPFNALATSSAAAGAFSLRQLLHQVHPMGTLIELVSLPASDWKRREFAPLSLAALEAALAHENESGFLSVRVVALHRAGLLTAGPHPAGFLQADVQVYTDSDDADGVAAGAEGADVVAPALSEEELRVRQAALDSACTALHEQVRLLLALHHRAKEAPHVPRRAQALWAYDAGQAASVADHAASLTLASSSDLQSLLGERSVLSRVRMAAALVAHDYGVLLRQNALGAERASDPRWKSIRREALEQEKVLVQAALHKLRESPPPTQLPPGAGDGAATGTKQTPAADAKVEPANAAGTASEKSDAPAADPAAPEEGAPQDGPRTPQAKAAPQPTGPPQSSIQLFAAKVRSRLLTRKLPAEALAAFEEELGRLESMESDSSASAHAIKHYVDWLSILPWGVCSDEKLDLAHAERVLEAEHFGLHDVKNQILELVAMGLLKNRQQTAKAAAAQNKEGAADSASTSASAGLEQTHGGKILCLVGPPGVGKTSIGRSIANALERKFFRLSVGGLGDVSEIKGHRRTYTGALPGQLVRALKTTGVSNPVVLVDEIDKLGYRGGGQRAGGGAGGDPSSALLEALDPEQNNAFTDHYLDVPVDLSRVLFVCTANDVDRIPGPLRDRMEVVHVSGYTAREKQQIAKRYLLPALYKATGVRPDHLTVDESAVDALIRWYCREPGVRALNKHLDKLFRKAAYKIARKQVTPAGEATAAAAAATAPAAAADAVPAVPAVADSSSSAVAPLIRINASNLSDYVGQRKYASDRMYPSATPIGVAMGLAYSEYGGATIFIESGVADSHADNPAAAALLGSMHQPQAERPARQRDELHDEDEDEGEDSSETDPPAGGAPAHRSGGGRGGFFCTGQLGSVMKESSSIAYTVAKRLLSQLQPRSLEWFQSSLLHLHLPTGAQPKDGPSAGVALTMSLLSLALHRPLAPDLAMTGELTLTGRVTAVGGIKEKLLAARRAQVTAVILPDQNRAAVHEVQSASPELLEGVRVHFVKHVSDVLPIAFPGIDIAAEAASEMQPHAAPSVLVDLPAAPGSPTASL